MKRENEGSVDSSEDKKKIKSVGVKEGDVKNELCHGSEDEVDGERGAMSERKKVDVQNAVEKIGKFIKNPKKISKATELLVNLINAEMTFENHQPFVSLFEECADSIFDDPISEDSKNIVPHFAKISAALADKTIDLSKSSENKEIKFPFAIWKSCFDLCTDLFRSDDSFSFSKPCTMLKEMIRSMENDRADVSRPIIMVIKVIYSRKSYAYAKSSVESTLKIARDHRLKFSEGPCREQIDEWTTLMTKEAAVPVGYKERTIRVVNSTAHPLLNRANQNMR